MRRYSFSVAGLFALALLVLVLSVLLRPRSEVTYGTGTHSFKAAFDTKPKVMTADYSKDGLGGLTSGTFHHVVIWSDKASLVWIAVVHRTAKQLDQELRATAKDFHGSFSTAHGVRTVSFSQKLSATEHVAPRYDDGLIKVKGSTLFYALGASNSQKDALRFIHDFHVVKF